MKIKLTMLLALMLFSSVYTKAQDFKNLVQIADSLKKQNKLIDAFDYYKKAIDLVLNDKEKVDQNDWISTLHSAGNLAGTLWDKRPDLSSLAQQYWSMIYGSRGEKLDDKIAFLKEYGVKDLIVYKELLQMGQYNNGGCSNGDTRYLIWFANGKTYVQMFDICNTYKPIAIPNSSLNTFYNANKSKILTDKLLIFYRVYDAGEANYMFIGEKGVLLSTIVHAHDLLPPVTDGFKVNALELMNKEESYKRNMATSLAKFVQMLRPEIEKYNDNINSAASRAAVGRR
ncbi:hypothetical protein ACVWYN_002500 [Pedobacter sp. UYP24]